MITENRLPPAARFAFDRDNGEDGHGRSRSRLKIPGSSSLARPESMEVIDQDEVASSPRPG
jgi:hypothetical protein